MKKETRNTIIKWAIYAVLLVATIVILFNAKPLFGQGYHEILDANGKGTGNFKWESDPIFWDFNSGVPFTDYIVRFAIRYTLKSIAPC